VEKAKEQWDQAKVLIEKQEYLAAKPFLEFVFTEMKRPLAAYYLGLAHDLEGDFESAVYYYDQCLEHSRKPMLKALLKKTRATLRQNKIKEAYSAAEAAIEKYPENKALLAEFKVVCQWAYTLDQKIVSSSYLSNPKLQTAYKVQTVTDQILILNNIRSDQDQTLLVRQRQYKGDFEIWNCHWYNKRKPLEVRFDLVDRDLERALEAATKKSWEVYKDETQSLAIRIGALLNLVPIKDKEMQAIIIDDAWEIRLCACTEL